MQIATIKSEYDLDKVLGLVCTIFPELRDGHRYDRTFWLNQITRNSEFLLYAKAGDEIIGAVFAWVDNDEVIIVICCVAQAYRGKGVGRSLIREIEKVIKTHGFNSVSLGSRAGAEGFYKSLGYTGSLLVQSEIHSVDQLKSIKSEYEVIYTRVYEETVNQVCLRLPKVDRELQRRYENTLPGCYTQMIFRKTLN